MNKTKPIATMIASLVFSVNVMANESISLGVKLLGASWDGDNGAGNSEFDSSNGGQMAFNISYSLDRFYTGLNLQGGAYKFDNNAPDQFTPAGRVSVSNVSIRQNDFDLLVGYYFWPQISFFVDIKAVGNNWGNNNYEQNFSGFGVGVSGFAPINENWTFFGSFGFIGNGNIKDGNENDVGDGASNALELGAVYRFDEANHINMGMKFRNYAFDYLDNSVQEYSVNALFVGFTHRFSINE